MDLIKSINCGTSRIISILIIIGLIGCKSEEKKISVEVQDKPNVIIYFCDDLGYGDLSTYGSKLHRTPALDALAENGLRLTSFYAAAAVCTPSRAALLTGCYPKRVDMHENGQPHFRAVLTRRSKKGLNPEEVTMADMLKAQGYATACLGKWHLGHQKEFLPARQGFDYFYGFTNYGKEDSLPLYENENVIDYLTTRDYVTQDLTHKAIDFITENKNNPFFLYLPNPMPHIIIGASPPFKGKSANGIYGDAIEEIDWSVQQIIAHLEKLELAENTLFIFTSDNGAENYHRIDEPVGGRNIPLHEWKGSSFEGGFRVPCLMYWPGTISAGQISSELVSALDILPTVANLSGGSVPQDRIIDGVDLTDFLLGKQEQSPRQTFYFYEREQLQAVRKGDWKLHLPMNNRYVYFWKEDTFDMPAVLYNINHDYAEQNNQVKEKTEILNELLELAEKARNDLGDKDIPCTNCREAAFIND
jgi:arylsulfatase A